MKKLLLFLILVSTNVFSQGPIFYFTSYGGENDDIGNCVIQGLDSGYIIVGSTASFGASQTDIYINKTDKLMQSRWQKTVGGFSADVAKSVVELADSSLVITGFSNSLGNGGYDAYICRTDKDGNLIWQKTYGGTDWDFAYSINKTSDGNLIICGETYSFGRGDKDGFILKLDYNGNTIWSKTYGGTNSDSFKEIIETSDGGFLAVGTTMSYGDNLGDMWIAKFNNMGDSVYFMTYGGIKKDVGNSVVEDKSGNFLIAGGSESFTNGKEDAYVIKLSNSYSLIWDRFFGLATEDEEVYSIKNATSGYGAFLICYTTKEVSSFKKDSKALLLSSLGYYIDGGRSGYYEDDEFYSIANCFDKGYILTGYTESYGAGEKDVYLVKYDSLVTGTGKYVVGLDPIIKDNLSWTVYPNPFNNHLFIKCSDNDILNKVEIINSNGSVIYQLDNIKSNKYDISIHDIDVGVYILRAFSNNSIYTKKIFCYK